jgi:anti-sigma factor RsiW
MKVTRDVIYDLLPQYFAGEVSADTRALIEEFFATDPEFGRMAERFRRLHADSLSDEVGEGVSDRERETFNRVKTRIRRRQAAVMWAIGALMAFGMAMLAMLDGQSGFRHPGVIIGTVFAAVAGVTWLSSRRSGVRAATLGASEDEFVGPSRRKTRRTRERA